MLFSELLFKKLISLLSSNFFEQIIYLVEGINVAPTASSQKASGLST